MASIIGYFIMVLGLSLLLAFAGINTGGTGVLDLMKVNVTTSIAGNTSITGIENINTISNPFLGSLLSIIVGLGVAGLSILSGKFSLGESLKVGAASFLLILLISDLRSIIVYTQTLTSFGFLTQLITYFIYIPLIGGVAITIYNWISGNN